MSFASRNLRAHFFRGAAGLGALGMALWLEQTSAWLSVALVPIAIWFFRGCPMCWTIGLFETAAQRLLASHEDVSPPIVEATRLDMEHR